MKQLIVPLACLLMLGACVQQENAPAATTSSTASSVSTVTMTGTYIQSSGKVSWSWNEGVESGSTIIMLTDDTGKIVFRMTCGGTANHQPVDGSLTAVRCLLPEGRGHEFAVFGIPGNIRISNRTVDEKGGFGIWEKVYIPQASSNSAVPAMKRAAMEWVTTNTGEMVGEGDMPSNKITLRVQGTGEEIYSTNCFGTTSTEMQDVEGSVASIQCWWAGGGDQYGVFIGEAEQLTIKHRTVDEEAGFGPWETMSMDAH